MNFLKKIDWKKIFKIFLSGILALIIILFWLLPAAQTFWSEDIVVLVFSWLLGLAFWLLGQLVIAIF